MHNNIIVSSLTSIVLSLPEQLCSRFLPSQVASVVRLDDPGSLVLCEGCREREGRTGTGGGRGEKEERIHHKKITSIVALLHTNYYIII